MHPKAPQSLLGRTRASPFFHLDCRQQTGQYTRESSRPPKLDNKDSAESDLPVFPPVSGVLNHE